MSITQYIVIGVFILALIVGVFVFAVFGGSSSSGAGALSITVWGTVPEAYITKISDSINSGKPGTISIDYVKKSPDTFESDLTEALAEGGGPDAVIIPHNILLKNEKKLALIPWSLLSENVFKDTFIQGGEVFLTDQGAYALPFMVDPLVMYWNRDIFNNASISSVPKYWDEMSNIAPKLTQLSESKVVIKSALPFGEYQNVNNAKEIISAIAMQAGSPIVALSGGVPADLLLTSVAGSNVKPFESSISFFTQFADPSSLMYSWNRSLPNSDKMFLAGNLAMYFGFASELSSLRAKNPNLNFDVARIPQVRNSNSKITYGNIYGLAIIGSSKNKQSAFQALSLMIGSSPMKALLDNSGLPPVRRDLLATLPGTGSGDVFFDSALWSRGWLDPNYSATSKYIQDMVESITSGASKPTEAVMTLGERMDELLKNK